MSEMKRIEEAKEEALWWSEWAQDQEFLSTGKNAYLSFFHYEDLYDAVFFWG